MQFLTDGLDDKIDEALTKRSGTVEIPLRVSKSVAGVNVSWYKDGEQRQVYVEITCTLPYDVATAYNTDKKAGTASVAVAAAQKICDRVGVMVTLHWFGFDGINKSKLRPVDEFSFQTTFLTPSFGSAEDNRRRSAREFVKKSAQADAAGVIYSTFADVKAANEAARAEFGDDAGQLGLAVADAIVDDGDGA